MSEEIENKESTEEHNSNDLEPLLVKITNPPEEKEEDNTSWEEPDPWDFKMSEKDIEEAEESRNA